MRLGCLPYLNVKPLVYTFEHHEVGPGNPSPARGVELVYAPPSTLADMLRAGEIAAAPVSSFACFENPELEICPGLCIAARGPVKSVLMLSKKPSPNIDTLALDAGSLSGASMLRIILRELYNTDPRIVRMAPEPVETMLESSDAALVIGNPAMLCDKKGLYVLDVAEEWVRLTDLPAVFAVWAGRSMTPELARTLQEAKRDGMAHIPDIAREESIKLGLSYEACFDYLSRVMVYDMGKAETAGLNEFRRRSIAHGLISPTGAVKR